jgi:hypothetical protein
MGVLEDVRNWLKEIPLWRELETIPKRTDDLELRIAALEEKLNGKWPADVCLKCGSRTMRVANTFGPDSKHMMQQMWVCGDENCNYHETRLIKPK